MKRALLFGLALGFGLALATLPGEASAKPPAGEFTLNLRLNGSPVFAGHTSPRGDGGTKGSIDAGLGNIVLTCCYAAACVCPGLTCTCGNVLGTSGAYNLTTGRLLAANECNKMVLEATNGMVTTAAASGSVLLDGGPGAECDHWGL